MSQTLDNVLSPVATNATMPASATANTTTALTITSVSGTQINLSFNTNNANQPNTFGNQVYIWQAGNEIPWTSPALKSQAITVNSPSGDLSFDGLDVTNLSYIVGYAVGPAVTSGGLWTQYPNVVASAWVPPAGGDSQYQYFTPSIDTHTIGATSLSADFAFLSGFNPQAAGAWAGIWVGTSPSYYNPPKWVTPISGSNNTGIVSFNNIQIQRGTSYTLGLYPTGFSPQQANLGLSRLAATHTFTN